MMFGLSDIIADVRIQKDLLVPRQMWLRFS